MARVACALAVALMASAGVDGDSVEACEVLLFKDGECAQLVNTYSSAEEDPKDFKFGKGSDSTKLSAYYRVKGSCNQVQFMDNDWLMNKGKVDVFGNKASCTRLPYDLRNDLGGIKIWAKAKAHVCTVKTYSNEGCVDIVNSYRSSAVEKEFKFATTAEQNTPTHYKVSGQCQLVQFKDNDWFAKQPLDIYGTRDCTELPEDLAKDLKGVKIWISEKTVKPSAAPKSVTYAPQLITAAPAGEVGVVDMALRTTDPSQFVVLICIFCFEQGVHWK